ncbi:MAG: cell wall metabolism sensor histidine kinase WalK [Pirellulales bacterium]|nr:cell wall metabolism sensor histidine kinase WalK [Pirellulales bacterium]
MNYFKTSLLLACVALALTIMFGLPWVWRLSTESGLWSDDAAWTRGLLIGASLVISWAIAGAIWLLALRQVNDSFQNLGQVADLSDEELSDPNEQFVAPPRSGWEESVRGVRRRLASLSNEVRARESDRSALELRARLGEAEQRRYASILRGVREPLLVINEFDELILANQAAEQLLDFDSGNSVGKPIAETINCPEVVNLLHEVRRYKRATFRSEELDVSLSDAGDSFQVAVWNLLEQPGWSDNAWKNSGPEPHGDMPEPRGAVAMFQDVSAEKKPQHRHAEFVAAVSHEMKTPLAGIRAYVEMLQDGDAEDDATRDEFLAVIDSQAKRLTRLVENLLNLARIESGVVKVSKSAHSLNEILEAAAEVVRPAMEERGNELCVELSPIYLNVYVDRDQILQAAINLLTNANKYTPTGGKITLRSKTLDKQVLLEVEDTGVGLSAEDCVNVFAKFYRVGKDKQMAEGTGLGLPLAKSIVEEVHGGCLSLRSEPGVGSTFTITLPAANNYSATRQDDREGQSEDNGAVPPGESVNDFQSDERLSEDNLESAGRT